MAAAAQRRNDPLDASWTERLWVLGSAGTAVVLAFAFGFAYYRGATLELIGLIPASVFAVGKFLPIWGVTGQSHFSPWQLGCLIWAMDTVTILTMVYGLELLYRIPGLEAGLRRIQVNAGLVLSAYPRIRRAAVIGVVLFVLFPIAGTGAIGGAFLGILLGLQRRVLIAAISLGGLCGGMLMAALAVNFASAVQTVDAMQSDPAVKWTIMSLVALTVIGALLWLNRAYQRALASARAASQADA
ncbi:MAG: hypothetical protein Tsb0020_42180 [Haliangiales bacterium]